MMVQGVPDQPDESDDVSEERRQALAFAHSAEIGALLSPYYDPEWGELGHSKHIVDLPASVLIQLAELLPAWQFDRRMNNSPTVQQMIEAAQHCPSMTFGGWHGMPDLLAERFVLDSFELPLDDATDAILLPLWEHPPDDGGVFEYVGPHGSAKDGYGPDYHLLHRVHTYADIAVSRTASFGERSGHLGERIRLWAWWD